MKIQCHNCAKTYLVSSDQIGEHGRNVKCTNCSYTWREYLKEASSFADVKEERTSGKNFLQNLVSTTLAFAVAAGLCVVVANGIFPREMNKAYKTISAYRDSMSYKLGHKKEQIESSNVKKLVVNEFYQDCLFLSNLRSS